MGKKEVTAKLTLLTVIEVKSTFGAYLRASRTIILAGALSVCLLTLTRHSEKWPMLRKMPRLAVSILVLLLPFCCRLRVQWRGVVG